MVDLPQGTFISRLIVIKSVNNNDAEHLHWEAEVRLDGWCEGGVRQQRSDGGGCATMRERQESVESPGTYVTE